MSVDVEKRRFTADEYQRMGEAGIFPPGDRVELIEGEILTMSPIGSPHAAAVARGTHALITTTGGQCIVRVQLPIRLDGYSEPEPDFALAWPRDDFYRTAHPGPTDVMLVIEAADTTLRYDREVKGPLYARSGIVEYWLVDLNDETVTCYSKPENGGYREVTTHRRQQSLRLPALPGSTILVDNLLG